MAATRRGLALLLTCLLMTSTVAAYKGSLLSRGPVENFTATDQNGDVYSFEDEAEGVVVVSFIFTRCPDVCPILTQLLIAVEAELTAEERADVTFVSISVDPEYDTPEVLKEYTERMGASWPHLTGTNETMEHVWEMFGVMVQQNVIDVHVMDYQPGEASVTVVDTSNNTTQNMFGWSGWTATQLLAEEAGWELNVSRSDNIRYLSGINGVNAPQDGTWRWELNVWHEANTSWSPTTGDARNIDALETPHLALMPSNGNRSALNSPNESSATSLTVQWPNGTQQSQEFAAYNGYHLTRGALREAGIQAEIEKTDHERYVKSIDNQSAPEDRNWSWNLFEWDGAEAQWELATVGMESMIEPTHLAWAPSYTDASNIPHPSQQTNGDGAACNGHGWEMGSGSSKHCMCDDGYTWAEDDKLSCVSETTENYNVGHSTITLILNEDLEPTVAWTGDRWRVEDFTSDVRELLEKEQLGGNQGGMIPSLSFVLTSVALAAAAARFGKLREAKKTE